MLTTQFVILILVFLIFIVLDSFKPILANTLLFLLFLWAMVTFELSTIQLVFYPVAFLFALWLQDKVSLKTHADSVDIAPGKPGGLVKGIIFHLFTIGVGIALIAIMFFMTSAKGQFLGVATLSVAGATFTKQATLLFAAAISGALGIIENRMILGVMKAFMDSIDIWPTIFGFGLKAISMIPFIGPFLVILPSMVVALIAGAFLPFMPFAVASLIFGLFHLVAYKISFGLVIWASLIMALWIVSYFITGKDDTAMNTAHYGWNGIQTMKETTTLAIGKIPVVVGG